MLRKFNSVCWLRQEAVVTMTVKHVGGGTFAVYAILRGVPKPEEIMIGTYKECEDAIERFTGETNDDPPEEQYDDNEGEDDETLGDEPFYDTLNDPL